MALTRPTPPTPPTIDKGEATEYTPKFDAHNFFEVPFKREENPVEKQIEKNVEIPRPEIVERKTPTPEEMAREAVANGSGALTKKTVNRPETETPAPVNNSATQNLPLTNISNDNPNRGKEILREFQNEDRQTFQTTETPRSFNRHQSENYSGIHWAIMLIFAGILSFVFVKKFLLRKNPKLKKSELFEDSNKKLQAVSEKISTPVKKSPPKKDEDKNKHFEVRV